MLILRVVAHGRVEGDEGPQGRIQQKQPSSRSLNCPSMCLRVCKKQLINEQSKTILKLEIMVHRYEGNLGEPLRIVREDVEKQWVPDKLTTR